MIGHSATWSMVKIVDFFKKHRNFDITKESNIRVAKIFRSREVKQRYITSIFTTLIGMAHAILLIVRNRPDMIVTNGPGTALPLCYIHYIFSKILLWNIKSKILFIESFCRV